MNVLKRWNNFLNSLAELLHIFSRNSLQFCHHSYNDSNDAEENNFRYYWNYDCLIAITSQYGAGDMLILRFNDDDLYWDLLQPGSLDWDSLHQQIFKNYKFELVMKKLWKHCEIDSGNYRQYQNQ